MCVCVYVLVCAYMCEGVYTRRAAWERLHELGGAVY